MMYWLIVAVLVILIIITSLWTIMGINREHKEYLAEKNSGKRSSGRMDAKDNHRKSSKTEEDDYKRSGGAASAPGKRRWKIILEDISTGEIFDYIFCESVGIGRTTEDVAFEKFLSIPDDRRISKVHCSIVVNKENLYLIDEGSKNHTYLNGKKIQKAILLQKDDVITAGETDLRVVKILREAR